MANRIISQVLPTVDRVRDLLHYNQLTGIFTWRKKPTKRIAIGDVAGHIRSDGYVVIQINGSPNYAHRLAWLYMNGLPSPENIDHRNGIRHDNRWDNLRDATHSINQQNQRKARSNSRTGVLGVTASGRGFRAAIGANGKNHYSTTFDSTEEAYAAYLNMKRKLHPGGTL